MSHARISLMGGANLDMCVQVSIRVLISRDSGGQLTTPDSLTTFDGPIASRRKVPELWHAFDDLLCDDTIARANTADPGHSSSSRFGRTGMSFGHVISMCQHQHATCARRNGTRECATDRVALQAIQPQEPAIRRCAFSLACRAAIRSTRVRTVAVSSVRARWFGQARAFGGRRLDIAFGRVHSLHHRRRRAFVTSCLLRGSAAIRRGSSP